MSSNPHNQNLAKLYAKLAKKVVESKPTQETPVNNKNINDIYQKLTNKVVELKTTQQTQVNNLNIKPNKTTINSNKTLDIFLSLYKPGNNNDNKTKPNPINKININNNSKKRIDSSMFFEKKEKTYNFSNNNDYLNKKRKYMTKEEEKLFLEEMKASENIDRMLEEIKKEKKMKLLEEQKKKENLKKLDEEKKKKKNEKKNNNINHTNYFLEAMGLTEEQMQKNNELQKQKKNEKDKNDKENNMRNIILQNSLNGFNTNNTSPLIIKEKLPNYYNYKVKQEDIYMKILSFDFYNTKSKTEIIPNAFDNELHYRYIWIPNFLNELKYSLLNEKAEKSDVQNYKDVDVKIKLTYLLQQFTNIALLKITPNKNLNEFKKKILKDNDLIAIYSENEKIDFDDITISNKKKLNYFLGLVRREYDSYELKIYIHSNDVEKYNLNYNNYNSKEKKEESYNIKYLNNINSSLREFKALFYLELSNFKDILNPKKLLLKNNHNTNNVMNTKSYLFINNIKSSNIYNSSQIDVLIKANQMQKNEVLLIQGPPGTGKTHTILGLTSLFMLNKNTKILICTQSNTAIDEICIRLMNKGLYDEKLNKINSNFIRFGYLDRRDKEKKYLDTHQGKLLEQKSLEYLVDFKFKEQLENANEEKEKIIKEINQLSIDKEKNAEQIKILENKKQALLSNLNKSKYEKQNYEYYLLSNSSILCTTLNNAGNEKLKKTHITYDYLIIDEACQCVEPSSLIPLCHGIKKLILVGDHMQLPATVFFPKAKNILYNRSLFERLIDNNIPRHILTIQYRMQTNIRQFISSLFYGDKLMDSDQNYVDKINNNIFYKIIDINKNFSFFDLNFSEENINEKMKSYYNIKEIGFTFELIKKINNKIKNIKNINNEYKYKYAIITPYQAQVKKFKEEKYNINELSDIDIAINTVDSFQGQERDIVIFSTVRSNNKNNLLLNTNKGEGENIGFLNDFRRMNVALSRAKLGCFIIGNSEKFKSDSYWEKLIKFCKDKKSFFIINSKNDYEDAMKNIFL